MTDELFIKLNYVYANYAENWDSKFSLKNKKFKVSEQLKIKFQKFVSGSQAFLGCVTLFGTKKLAAHLACSNQLSRQTKFKKNRKFVS